MVLGKDNRTMRWTSVNLPVVYADKIKAEAKKEGRKISGYIIYHLGLGEDDETS